VNGRRAKAARRPRAGERQANSFAILKGATIMHYKFGGTVILLLAGLLVLTIIFGSWYTIDQTQRGVLLRNGALVEVVQPGLHFKWPWIETVSKIDMQTHNFTFEKVNSYSADQQPADLRISVTLHVAPDKVGEMYSRFGGDQQAAISRLITPHMNQEVKVVFGQYTAQRAITARGQLNADAAKALNDAIAYDPIFVIEGVQIEDIEFSKDYIRSVEARMQAEVAVQQRQQELAQERIKAEIAVTQATGRANSIRAEAQAQADATTLRGNAEASAIKAKGEALAANPSLVALIQAERWNGVLPTTLVPGSTVPFLNVH
jgi:regulator of protease activity HflC (stomatin/prohibitin superfamily)